MRVYAESSAVLAWLLGEAPGETVRKQLTDAEQVFTSVLTHVEIDRVLIRSQVVEKLNEADVMERRRLFARAGRHWNLVRIHDEVLERARRPFPTEPIRTLDALHLASALSISAAVPELAILSLDDSVRNAAEELGFNVVP